MSAPDFPFEITYREIAELFLESLPRRVVVVACVVVLGLGSAAAYWQFTRPFTWHEPYGFWRAWLHPIEWNIDAGLPEIVGRINAVEALDGRVVVAGNTGLLAVSQDEGRSWIQLSYSPDTNSFAAPREPSTASARGQGSPLEYLSRVIAPPLEAASQSSAAPSLNQSPAQQRSSPPDPSPDQKRAEAATSPDGVKVNTRRWDFGPVSVGERSQEIPIQFTGGLQPVMTSQPAIAGTSPEQFSIRPDCGLTLLQLLPGQICNVFVAFAPSRVGRFQAALVFAKLSVTLTGVGTEKAATPTPPARGEAPDNSAAAPADNSTTAPRNNSIGTPPASATGTRVEPVPPDLVAFGYCVSSNCELIERGDETAFISTDGGLSWQRAIAFEGTSTHGEFIAELKQPAGTLRDADRDPVASNRFWALRSNGGLFRVDEGQWIPVTRTAVASLPGHAAASGDVRYGRFLPPWYLLLFTACGLLLVPLTRLKASITATDLDRLQLKVLEVRDRNAEGRSLEPAAIVSDSSAIGNQGTADRPLAPGEPDALGLGIIATGLAFFLRNENTKPPLVIAINGRWGSGKSSLMNLLKARLEDYGACPVSFNAWHHQQEDQLLAALLEAVRAQAVPPLSGLSGWTFRARLAWHRLQRSWIQLAFVLGAILLLWRIEVHLRESGLSIGNALSSLLNWTREAPIGPDAERAASALDAARQLREAANQTTDAGLAAQLRAQAEQFVRQAAQGSTSTTFDTVLRWVQDSSLLALVAAAGAGIRALSKGLRAFATNPASLLALDSGSTATSDLEAQTGFRQRFAAEFADVTGVLGRNKRMMILIDDLDRCRPEKVREVLEAVNFLCSSGECFVVLGMARNMVEHCVGLSFRRVVDTMPWDAFDLSPDEIDLFLAKARATSTPGDARTRVDLEAKRLAFARLFLDKLIQIEVSIPEPTPIQKRKLFETDAELRKKQSGELRVAKWLGISRVVTQVMVPVAQAAVLFLLIMGGGLYLGGAVAPLLSRLTSPAPAPQEAAREIATATPSSPAEKTPATPTEPQVRPQVLAATASTLPGWLTPWPFYAALLAAFAMASLALRRMPHQLVKDDRPFTDAIAIWHPLVMTDGARNTPRTARRFQNRVRYLAMRQRALVLGAPVSRLEGWIRKWLKVPAAQPSPLLVLPANQEVLSGQEEDLTEIARLLSHGAEGKCTLANVRQSAEGAHIETFTSEVSAEELRAIVTGEVRIPEPILIALAAIDELAPDWIDDPREFQAAFILEDGAEPGSRKAALSEASARHLIQFKHWHNLMHYRRAYLRLCSELDHTAIPKRAPSPPESGGSTLTLPAESSHSAQS